MVYWYVDECSVTLLHAVKGSGEFQFFYQSKLSHWVQGIFLKLESFSLYSLEVHWKRLDSSKTSFCVAYKDTIHAPKFFLVWYHFCLWKSTKVRLNPDFMYFCNKIIKNDNVSHGKKNITYQTLCIILIIIINEY